MPLPQEAQQAIPDSLAVTPDTTVVDTTIADTTSAITQLNREITEAGRLLATGEWELFVNRLYERLAELAANLIPKLSAALLIFLLFYVVYRILFKVIRRVLNRSKRVDVGLEALLTKTYRVVAMVFILVMVLDQLGLNVAALLAGLSIAGIAVGFAARDTLENFISGISILMDRPFRIGDNVQVDGTFGTVEEITLRSTRLRTLNNEIMVMPNIQMINQKLINHTMLNTLRVEIPFGIAYKEYPQEAREVVLKLTEGDERLHDDYKSEVVVLGLNDSSVDMALRVFLRNPKLEVPVRLEYIEKVREALREADIEIPFPHLQLFVDEAQAFENSFLMQPALPLPKGKGEEETGG